MPYDLAGIQYEIGQKIASSIRNENNLPVTLIDRVCNIIDHLVYLEGHSQPMASPEKSLIISSL